MAFVVIVGSQGRMSSMLQELCRQDRIEYRLYSTNAPEDKRVESFAGASGVIDFSLPQATNEVIKLCREARVPLVCGTTGWASEQERDMIFEEASREIPVVLDSNFSMGVELLCQTAELLAKQLDTGFGITDIHHHHKKDSPSGTALKLAKRIQEQNQNATVTFNDFRLGEIPGEHRVLVSWKDETMELMHRAHNRKPFAQGALHAYDWAQKQKPGLYRMKDVLS